MVENFNPPFEAVRLAFLNRAELLRVLDVVKRLSRTVLKGLKALEALDGNQCNESF